MDSPIPLTIFSIERLKEIAREPGIYYLLDGERLTYIGHSRIGIQNRVRCHLNAGRRFSHVSYALLDEKLTLAAMRSIERALIQYWRPPENKRFKLAVPKRSPETPPPDFITQQNKKLHEQIAALEAKVFLLERQREASRRLEKLANKLKKQKKAPRPPQTLFPYLGGVLHLEGKTIYLQSSNQIGIPDDVKTVPALEPLETPNQTVNEEIQTKPVLKVVSFQEKIQSNVRSFFQKALNKIRST